MYMGVFDFKKKKVKKEGINVNEVSKWIENVLKQDIPESVKAFCFNLYEDENNSWSMELVGAGSFDREDTDWATDEITDFGTRTAPFVWNQEAEWDEVLGNVVIILKEYFKNGKYANVLKSKSGVGVGFVDGELEILHVTNEQRNSFVEYLKNEITDKTSLEKVIDVFERMCEMPIKEDKILFEIGTFSFTGKPLFYFSLVRQFPNDQEEYYQIHVDVLFEPTIENGKFKCSVRNEDLDENIFEYIRKSEVFERIKNDEYVKIDIYMDET